MKALRAFVTFLAALFVYIFYAIGSAFAQALPVAAPAPVGGFDWGLVLILVAVALGVGYIVLKKKNPDLTEKLTDLLHKKEDNHAALVATNTTLANVVASPPVQAAVNSTAQNGPGAPLAPAPIPREVPNMQRAPGMLYPKDYFGAGNPPVDEAGYPTGGPYAAMRQPFPIPGYVPNMGNPDWKPAPALTPAEQADYDANRALYDRYTQAPGGVSGPAGLAVLEEIKAKLGIAGSDGSSNTAANVILARWLATYSGHG